MADCNTSLAKLILTKLDDPDNKKSEDALTLAELGIVGNDAATTQFRALDTNGSGALGLNELNNLFQSATFAGAAGDDMELDLNELKKVAKSGNDELVEAIFKKLDDDNSGGVTSSEIGCTTEQKKSDETNETKNSDSARQGGGRRRGRRGSARRARGRSSRRGSARRARGRSGRRSVRRSKRARGRRVSRRR